MILFCKKEQKSALQNSSYIVRLMQKEYCRIIHLNSASMEKAKSPSTTQRARIAPKSNDKGVVIHRRKQEEMMSPRGKKNVVDNQWMKEITKLNDQIIVPAIQNSQFSEALSSLKKLEVNLQVHVSLLQNHYKLNPPVNKKMMHNQLFVCFNNFALIYQTQNNLDDCLEYLDKALSHYEQLQGYLLNRDETPNYLYEFVLLQLPYCAVLSSAEKHDEAIIYAQRSLTKLNQCFKVLQAICSELIIYNSEAETAANSRNLAVKSQTVNFKEFVLIQAEKMLNQMGDLPSTIKLASSAYKQHFENVIEKMFFWKNNETNNETNLKKELKIGTNVNARNILGLQKQTNKVFQEFSVRNVCTIKPKRIKENQNNDSYYVLSKQRMTYMVFLASICYFKISTEIRSNLNLDLPKTNGLKVMKSYEQLSDSKHISRCKVLHLKAIEYAAKYLPPQSEYLTYLLRQFNVQYKELLDQIHQQDESVFTMSKNNESKDQIQESISDYGLSQNLMKTNVHQFNLKKKNRQRSQSKKRNQISKNKGLK